MTDDLPRKLKDDAVTEANFEIRFDPDPSSIPEVLYGRLADTSEWRGFTQKRLPAADIPAALRRADPNLRYQASIALTNPDGASTVRIGPQMIAYARLAPYPGWEVLGSEIDRTIDVLFAALPNVSVTRLGLRYVNALRSDVHGINGIGDLNLNIVIAKEQVTKKLNLNYLSPVSDDSTCTLRIATSEFVQGQVPDNTTVIADLDVYTNEPYKTSNKDVVKQWKELAHAKEKYNFFRLLTPETIQRLRVD